MINKEDRYDNLLRLLTDIGMYQHLKRNGFVNDNGLSERGTALRDRILEVKKNVTEIK